MSDVGRAEGCDRLGGFLGFWIALFLSEVLGAEVDHRARTDGQGLVDGTLTTNHGAFAIYLGQSSTSSYLSFLIRCVYYNLRFAED